jgi:hypothetical protein
MSQNDPADGAPGADPGLDLPADMFRSSEQIEDAILSMMRGEDLEFSPAKIAVVKEGRRKLAIFEGDIVLGTADEVRAALDEGRGIGITGAQFRWPGGRVPYVCEEALRPRVEAAIKHWHERTPIRLVKRTREKDYVSFQAGGGCSSRVGRVGGKQPILLGPGCGIGSTIHEIGHTLGLWHEQSRSDRDEHIEIIWENINPAFRFNFDKHILDGDDLGPYDFGSIMHYPANAFGINNQVTIRAKGGQPIGQRNGLSAGDVAAIKLMYPDLDWPD